MLSFITTFLYIYLSVTQAQDIETARSLFKEAEELHNEGNLLISLPKYLTCLDVAKPLGSEADDIVRECQETIPQIYIKLGENAADVGDNETAMANYQRALKLATAFGNNEEVIESAKTRISRLSLADALKQGQVLEQTGNYDAAVKEYTKVANAALEGTEEAKEAFKLISNCYLKQAVICMKKSDNSGCLEYAQLAAQTLDSPNAEKLIGVSAFNLELYNIAISAFEAFLALSPNDSNKSQIIVQLAIAYERSNDIEKACAYYQQLLNDSKYGDLAKNKVKEFKCDKKSRRK